MLLENSRVLVNFFYFNQGESQIANKAIDAIESFYHSLNVDTRFSDYEPSSKVEAIHHIVEKLESHGMVALGENRVITPQLVREILNLALV